MPKCNPFMQTIVPWAIFCLVTICTVFKISCDVSKTNVTSFCYL